ncbi:hypothetical protein HNQ96_001950 [Aminobacter lissarensis]|uniref:Uncharacterized protein n=1 Tax=Aminobacter carboxidus TaxID=376165 RepID=A0A8E1WEV5_9HYPH|nr:hypothetical protein [Aminobacter lissarensis]MBB6466092.1 hypothetical protein [Aminobacter lissarensis]
MFLALAATAGCASGPRAVGPVDPLKYDAMACAELDVAMGTTAAGISRTAISRGTVGQWNVPAWAPGGTKAVTAIQERQTARIDALRQEQIAIDSVRKRKCR